MSWLLSAFGLYMLVIVFIMIVCIPVIYDECRDKNFKQKVAIIWEYFQIFLRWPYLLYTVFFGNTKDITKDDENHFGV